MKIDSMTMRDAMTGELIWETQTVPNEFVAYIPKKILNCQAVSREIVFSSEDLLKDLSVTQSIRFLNEEIEVWNFKFGFVIPHSRNTWQQQIVADPYPIPSDELTGNLVIISEFKDGENVLLTNEATIHYV